MSEYNDLRTFVSEYIHTEPFVFEPIYDFNRFLDGRSIRRSTLEKSLEVLPSHNSLGNKNIVFNLDSKFPLLDKFNFSRYFFNKVRYKLSHISINYHCLFTIGDTNIIIGMLETTGQIFLNHSLIESYENFLSNLSEDTEDLFASVKESLFNVLEKMTGYRETVLNNHNAVYGGYDPKFIIANILERMYFELGRTYYDITPKKLLEEINEHYINAFNNDENDQFTKTILCNNNTLYRKVITRMVNQQQELYKKALIQGLKSGFKLITPFRKMGYSELGDDPHIFKKAVNIKPMYYILNGKYFQIKEEDRENNPYFVDYLQIDLEKFFDLTSSRPITAGTQTKHPNVASGSGVCIGSANDGIRNKMVRDLSAVSNEDIIDFLHTIEKSLEIINFDSSYYSASPKFYELGQLVGSDKEVNFVSEIPETKTTLKRIS